MFLTCPNQGFPLKKIHCKPKHVPSFPLSLLTQNYFMRLLSTRVRWQWPKNPYWTSKIVSLSLSLKLLRMLVIAKCKHFVKTLDGLFPRFGEIMGEHFQGQEFNFYLFLVAKYASCNVMCFETWNIGCGFTAERDIGKWSNTWNALHHVPSYYRLVSKWYDMTESNTLPTSKKEFI